MGVICRSLENPVGDEELSPIYSAQIIVGYCGCIEKILFLTIWLSASLAKTQRNY
jgi:hypothetical protein